jgi:hypothetical protein
MTLQKDFTIYRLMALNSKGKYEYQLFREGVSIKTLHSNEIYRYAAVLVDPIDDSVLVTSFRRYINEFSQRDLEDAGTFIVPVTIKS